MVITGDVTVVVEDNDNEPLRLDELTGQLHGELLLLDLPEVAREALPGTSGAKSGILHSLTTLVVSGGFSVALLRSLTAVVRDWIQRGGARKAVLESGGHRLEIEGASKKTQEAAVEAWIRAVSAEGQAEQEAPAALTTPAQPALLEGSTGEA
jgi:hypothetical protein